MVKSVVNTVIIMNKNLFLSLLLAFVGAAAMQAQPPTAPQKAIYLPDSIRPYGLDNPEARWAWRRSVQTQNLILLWEKGFGDDPRTAPALEGRPMTFDVANMLVRLERFYRYFRDTLKFASPGSKSERYKMMVMVNYSLEGTAYGGTYDNFIGALWVAPNRLQDRKLNVLAHELGHSFQLQIYADGMSEGWGAAGGGFFEMTSQWMLWRVNPDWITDEKYHFDAFQKLTHKGFLHPENIYHSPYVVEWWAEKHGLESIATLYRQGKQGEDPAMTYMRMYGLSQQQFNDEMFDCYRHLVNFDFAYARRQTRPYACTFSTPMQPQAGGWQRPDTACIPENYGFNAIKVPISPKSQKAVAQFRALPGSGSGYRYGFVGVATNDQTYYGSVGSAPKGKAVLRLPEGVELKNLYFVVMGAPASHDLNPASRRFPYEVKFK